MFNVGDEVMYDDYNVNRWVKAVIDSVGMKDGKVTYGCEVCEGERPELPSWHRNSQWGYENQFRAR